MTLALEFEAQNLNFAWTLPGIDRLEDPFVIVPGDCDALYDMTIVADGLKLLADTDVAEVPETAIQEAISHTHHARDAALIHSKASTLNMLPDPSPDKPLPLGWGCYVNRDGLRDWHNRLASDIFHSAAPIYMDGPPAVAARLGLRTLVERGEPNCDPMKLAVIAGEVAAKYSGAQTLTVPEADEAYHATVAELDAAYLNRSTEEIRRLQQALRWVVDHTVFRY